jgi:8-oxo-dGTP pyrophosphatase MutT (NUDIX family)
MLDLDPTRTPVPTRDAATLIVVRDAPEGLEVFCVERHPKSGFMGGAIVFPGGKVDAEDASADWEDVAVGGGDADRSLRIAACREALEEAALLPVVGGALSHTALLALRAGVAKKEATIPGHLRARRLRLDLAALRPFARWITPVAESRRYDTRFYLTVLPAGQEGAHDERETTSSFWASPASVLARFDEGSVQLAPPTHRTLELLTTPRTTADAVAMADRACLEPICPVLVAQGGLPALVLPGDPAHDVREPRVPGRSRFVLREGRWRPEDAPPARESCSD